MSLLLLYILQGSPKCPKTIPYKFHLSKMIAVWYIIGGAFPVMSCPERCILIGAGQMKVPLGIVTADVFHSPYFPGVHWVSQYSLQTYLQTKLCHVAVRGTASWHFQSRLSLRLAFPVQPQERSKRQGEMQRKPCSCQHGEVGSGMFRCLAEVLPLVN